MGARPLRDACAAALAAAAINAPPAEAAVRALLRALRDGRTAVLRAPPGAGETTRVPLVLRDQPWARGRSVTPEPRHRLPQP